MPEHHSKSGNRGGYSDVAIGRAASHSPTLAKRLHHAERIAAAIEVDGEQVEEPRRIWLQVEALSPARGGRPQSPPGEGRAAGVVPTQPVSSQSGAEAGPRSARELAASFEASQLALVNQKGV